MRVEENNINSTANSFDITNSFVMFIVVISMLGRAVWIVKVVLHFMWKLVLLNILIVRTLLELLIVLVMFIDFIRRTDRSVINFSNFSVDKR